MKVSLSLLRGLVTIFLALTIGLIALSPVANQWRGVIDSSLGTTSVLIVSGDKYASIYNSTDDLIAAHEELGIQEGAEGSVLLKNINSALPFTQATPKVTLLGMGSEYPFLGGEMGSTISVSEEGIIVDALEGAGFSVNPTMVSVYQTLGSVVTGTTESWFGTQNVYGYRPAGFSTPYEPSEPALSTYGADAGIPDYATSFSDYDDAAIVVISRPGSEGSDYYPVDGIDETTYGTDTPLSLVTNEQALIDIAKANFDTVIVLLNTSSTMEIDDLKNDAGVDAIMYVGFPGTYGFQGVAQVLNGDVSPSGYLSDTYAVDTTMAPAAQNFGSITLSDTSMIVAEDSYMGVLDVSGGSGGFGGGSSLAAANYIVEAEGIYTGYRYYETRYYDSIVGAGDASSSVGASNGSSSWIYEDEVSYAFGYGLSYTTFSQTLDELKIDGSTLTAEVTVTNTGQYAGKYAAQLYASVPYTDYDKENDIEKSAIQLLGYEKTDTLAAGDSQTLTITVDLKYLASWDSSAKDGLGGWILDGGEYYFTIGDGAHEAVNNVLKAQGYSVNSGNTDLVVTKQIGNDGSVDETTFAQSATGVDVVNQLADADVNYYDPGYATYLSRSDWSGTFPVTYDDLVIGGDHEDEWITHLTNEDYYINANGEVANINGSTDTLTLDDLIGVDDLSDTRWSVLVNQIPVDELFAKIAKGGNQSDIIEEIQSPVVYQNDGPNGFSSTLSARGLNADDANASYNMATNACNVVIGNTFNKEIALAVGELMGNDGLWSGNYEIWGAAVNLHRSAYNGRNHEYYSEDPMVANYMASAVIEGGAEYGVIIGFKHFAFNDQETSRTGVAPYMTEQKARELELRAFQGPVEDAGALGGMTSFTRIGATAVNNSTPLLVNILRDEWGFKGLLSTDMVSNTGYFRPEDCIINGVTMLADFSTNETLADVQNSWPYMTIDLISSDATLVAAARQDMIYQLYAFNHSAVQNINTVNVTPWWETTMHVTLYTSLGISILAAGAYALEVAKFGKGRK